ncbi:MAG TPA: hypothetical protein VJ488_02345, partial [Dehalococcoidia bacterium]|nr:hypothetical protein [Dehalococcoidia bacterium]
MLKQRTKNSLACITLGLLICSIIIAAPGCIKITMSPSASGPSTPSSLPQTIQPAPAQSASIIITAFIADPPSITAGNSSKLSWNVSGAEFVNIDPGIGRVDLSAEIMVSPVVTTVYTLTAGNASNTIVATVQVIVIQPASTITTVSGLPLIHFFSAEPQVINTGESSTISW